MKTKVIRNLVVKRDHSYDKFNNERITQVILNTTDGYIIQLNRYTTQDYVVVYMYVFKNVKNLHEIDFKCPDITIELEFEGNELVKEIWYHDLLKTP